MYSNSILLLHQFIILIYVETLSTRGAIKNDMHGLIYYVRAYVHVHSWKGRMAGYDCWWL